MLYLMAMVGIMFRLVRNGKEEAVATMDSHSKVLILKNLDLEEGWMLHWNKIPLLRNHCLLRNGRGDEEVATVNSHSHREGQILLNLNLEEV